MHDAEPASEPDTEVAELPPATWFDILLAAVLAIVALAVVGLLVIAVMMWWPR